MKKSKKYDILSGGRIRLNLGSWDEKDFDRFVKLQDKRLEKQEKREAKRYERETLKDW